MIIKPRVEREGKWWEIHFDLLHHGEQVTQARRLKDVPQMAREVACLAYGSKHIDTIDFQVRLDSIKVGDVDILVAGKAIIDERARAHAEVERAKHDTWRYVMSCHDLSIPVRDIAYLVGITPQRVSQIVRNSR